MIAASHNVAARYTIDASLIAAVWCLFKRNLFRPTKARAAVMEEVIACMRNFIEKEYLAFHVSALERHNQVYRTPRDPVDLAENEALAKAAAT